MLAAELVYECVRYSITIPNGGFTYENFVKGETKSIPDYAQQTEGVYDSINKAIMRLRSMNKINFKVKEVFQKKEDGDGNDFIEGTKLTFGSGEIINVVDSVGEDYVNYSYRTTDNGHTAFLFAKKSPDRVFVEYRPDIPRFSEANVLDVDDIENGRLVTNPKNIELSDYGITDAMCDAIKEFVKSDLTEYLAPDMSIIHNERAESYFQSLPNVNTSFYQHTIRMKDRGLFRNA